MKSLAVVALLLLSGCATTPSVADAHLPGDIAIGRDVPPKVDPVYEFGEGIHREDVTTPAKLAVSSYLDLTDLIGSEAGRDANRIAGVVSPLWLPRELEGFQDYQNQGIRTVGQTRFDHFEVQSARLDAAGQLEVAVFLCVDSSKVLIIGVDDDEPPESLREWLFAPRAARSQTTPRWNRGSTTWRKRARGRGFENPL